MTAGVGDRAQLAGSSARPAMADTGNPAGE
jgi:hypothetical protein